MNWIAAIVSRKTNICVVNSGSALLLPCEPGVLMTVRSATVNAWPSRYELLDGLRGLAALAVVLHHLRVFDGGHFAVMVFFVISGYCITASAESCRRNGLGFGQFMARRIKRIYPLHGAPHFWPRSRFRRR
jgi:hypothetical protein